MITRTRQDIEARLHEIDEWLREREAAELTEGWLGCGPDADEVSALYQEREELLRDLSLAS